MPKHTRVCGIQKSRQMGLKKRRKCLTWAQFWETTTLTRDLRTSVPEYKFAEMNHCVLNDFPHIDLICTSHPTAQWVAAAALPMSLLWIRQWRQRAHRRDPSRSINHPLPRRSPLPRCPDLVVEHRLSTSRYTMARRDQVQPALGCILRPRSRGRL